MRKPINVIQFTCPNGFYGAERWILALAKNLDEEVINCGLVVTVEPNSKDLEVATHYRALNKKVFEVPMNNRFDISVILRLCKLVKSERIDIIHSHGYKSDILGLIVARVTGIRAVATPHGFVNVEDWKLRFYYSLGNKILRWFDVVAPLSQQLCRDMESLNVKKDKIRYIQNGVDLDEVEIVRSSDEDSLKKNKKLKRIGFIGQITRRKNIFDILDIFEALSRNHDNLELVLLGDGEQREELQEYANKLSAGSSIEFAGFQDNRLNWLKTFDLFVMTSTLEGIPRCLMEAMAMGIPAAAYEIPGIDQLIVNEKTGFLAPFGDKKTLESHWEKLLFNQELARQTTNAAREFVLNNFSGARMARDYTELYQEMVGDALEVTV